MSPTHVDGNGGPPAIRVAHDVVTAVDPARRRIPLSPARPHLAAPHRGNRRHQATSRTVIVSSSGTPNSANQPSSASRKGLFGGLPLAIGAATGQRCMGRPPAGLILLDGIQARAQHGPQGMVPRGASGRWSCPCGQSGPQGSTPVLPAPRITPAHRPYSATPARTGAARRSYSPACTNAPAACCPDRPVAHRPRKRGVRQLWKPSAWSSADHRSRGEPVTGSPRPAGAPVNHRDEPPAGAPVHHRDGRSRRRDRAGRRLRPRACPGRRSTHPASPASRQAERPLRLPRKIRPLRKIRATGAARILRRKPDPP